MLKCVRDGGKLSTVRGMHGAGYLPSVGLGGANIRARSRGESKCESKNAPLATAASPRYEHRAKRCGASICMGRCFSSGILR